MIITFFQSILFLVFVYFSGQFFLSFLKINNQSQSSFLFKIIMTGFYSLVVIWSMLKSNFFTINTVLFLWVLIWLISSKKITKPKFKNYLKLDKFILEIVLFHSIITTINLLKIYNDYELTLTILNLDALSDVTRAIFLNNTGIENSNTNFIQLPNGLQPYHYFESWVVAFISFIFQKNYWVAQGVIFHSFILTLIYTGFRSITYNSNTKLVSISLSVLVLVFSGFITRDISNNFSFFKWTISLGNNVFDEPWWTRMSVIYPIVILALNYLYNKSLKGFLFTILVIPFLSVTLTVPILASCCIYIFIISLVIKKNYKLLRYLLLPVLCAFLYKGFYFLFSDTSSLIEIPTISYVVNDFLESSLKTKLVIVIEKLIQTLILFSPALITLLILIPNRIKFLKFYKIQFDICLFLIIVCICSLIMWQLVPFVFGSSFFYYYTFLPFLNISILYLIYKSIENNHSKINLFIFYSMIILFFSFYIHRSFNWYQFQSDLYYKNVYSSNFLKRVSRVCEDEFCEYDLTLGVKIESHSEITSIFFNDGLSLCGYYLYGMIKAPALISLSRADLPYNKLHETEHSENFTKQTSFYQYRFSDNNKTLSIDSVKKNFIIENNIEFACVSKYGIVPESIKNLIEYEVTDSLSGERFILFK